MKFRTLCPSNWCRLLIRAGTCTLLLAILPAASLSQQVEFQAATTQPTFVVAEPIVLELSLSNRGPEPLRFYPMMLGTQMIRIQIRGGGSAARSGAQELRAPFVTDPPNIKTLPPGESYRLHELIHFDARNQRLVFPEAGQYTLSIEYLGIRPLPDQPPTATVTVTIVSPPVSELEGTALFSEQDTAAFVANQSRAPEIVNRLTQYAAENPQSLFGAYARFYVARHQATGYYDKPADLEAAAATMKAAANRDSFQFQPHALWLLGEWSYDAGNPVEAQAYLERLSTLFPNAFSGKREMEIRRTIKAASERTLAPRVQ